VCIDFASARGTQMLRSVLATIALVGVLAVKHPVFADPVPATASDAQAAAPASEQVASPAPASSSLLDVTAPANAELDKAPAGFGWG
jgi:hypothetical protein